MCVPERFVGGAENVIRRKSSRNEKQNSESAARRDQFRSVEGSILVSRSLFVTYAPWEISRFRSAASIIPSQAETRAPFSA